MVNIFLKYCLWALSRANTLCLCYCNKYYIISMLLTYHTIYMHTTLIIFSELNTVCCVSKRVCLHKNVPILANLLK